LKDKGYFTMCDGTKSIDHAVSGSKRKSGMSPFKGDSVKSSKKKRASETARSSKMASKQKKQAEE